MAPLTWRPHDDPGANDGWRYVWLDKWTGGDVRPVRLTWQPGREVPPQPPRGRALLHVWLKAFHRAASGAVRTA